jgi:hypothetical protein
MLAGVLALMIAALFRGRWSSGFTSIARGPIGEASRCKTSLAIVGALRVNETGRVF